MNLDDISKKNERLERLKQFTADDRILASVDNVAFTQEELMGLLGKCERTIYLCGKRFVIPGDIGYVTYVGVKDCTVEFGGNTVEAGIDLYNVEFEIGSYLADISENIDLDKCFSRDIFGKGIFETFFANNPMLGIKLLRLAVKKGNVDAQIYLGICYIKGFGVVENKEESLKWYRKAAGQGQVKMQKILGDYYMGGAYGEKNAEEAVKWYRLAAEQGNAEAQCCLGDYYYKKDRFGLGAGYPLWLHRDTDNAKETIKWYRLAAEQGNVNAQYGLGNCYRYGYGVAMNTEEAIKWYQMAAEQGNEDALAYLSKRSEEEQAKQVSFGELFGDIGMK